MYFFWQAAFSIPLWSNTVSKVTKGLDSPHTNVQLPESFHYHPLFVFGKGGAGRLLSTPGGIEPPRFFTHRMINTMETHPLSVRRKRD